MTRHLLKVAQLVFWALILAIPTAAQQNVNLEQGLKPFGLYQGGNLDSVSMTNGNLTLHIPLLSYPQRGQLRLDFFIRYNNKGWHVENYVDGGGNERQRWAWGGSGVEIVRDQTIRAKTTVLRLTKPNGDRFFVNMRSALTPDGSSHQLEAESVDTSGIMDLGTVAVDRMGIRYTQPTNNWSTNGNDVSVEDPNGNKITASSSGWTDTLGRSIPGSIPSDNTYGFASKSNLLPGVPNGSNSRTWVVPGPTGTSNITINYSQLTLTTSFGFPNIQEQGVTDKFITSIVLPNGRSWSFQYNSFGDLTQITLPTGGTISYGWGTAGMCYIGDNITPVNRAVTSRTVNANDGTGPKTWTYSWSNPAVVTDPANNDTLHTRSSIGASCSVFPTKTEYYQGTGANRVLIKAVETIYNDGLWNPRNLYTNDLTAVNVVALATKTTLKKGPNANDTIIAQQTTSYDCDLQNPSQCSSFGFYNAYDDVTEYYPLIYGSVMQSTESDYGALGSGTPGPVLRKTVNAWLWTSNSNYWTRNMLDLPSSVTIQDGAGAQVALTTYGYDDPARNALSSGITTQHNNPPSGGTTYRGNQTSSSRWLNTTGGYLTTNTDFFDTGMVKEVRDPLLHPTTFEYSATYVGAYVTKVTNALGQFSTFTYNFNSGLQASATDPNSQTTSFTHDNMFRLVQTSYPDTGQVSFAYTSSAPFKVTVTSKITSAMNYVVEGEVDGLGRLRFTRQTSDPQGTVYTRIDYDALGRTQYSWNPTRCNITVGTPPGSCAGEDTYGKTEAQYDALGRVTKVIPPDGSASANNVTTAYDGNVTTVTDQAGKQRRSYADALGRLIQVDEPFPTLSTPAMTLYSYDTLDNLTCVVQKGSDTSPFTTCAAAPTTWRPRSFSYDSLSRLTQANNPESGTINYAYDDDGNLLTKTAPAPNQTGSTTVTTNFTYDQLHRLKKKTYSDGTTPLVRYSYDGIAFEGCASALSTANAVGYRTAMCDGPGTESWAYGLLGRVSTDRRTTGTVTKDFTYTYNLDGSVAAIGYPSGRTITYQPSAAGRTLWAKDLSNSINYAWGTCGPSSDGACYAPHGAFSALKNGASLVSTYFYNNRLQPCRISVKSSGTAPGSCGDATTGNVLDFTYNFDSDAAPGVQNNGNVGGITNNKATTRSQEFAYDELNRLASAQTTSNLWGNTYVYDIWGNLLHKDLMQGKTDGEYLQQSVTTKNQISGLNYDAAGNQTNDGSGRTFTYDAENRICSVGGTSCGTGTTYSYDGDGKRVQKSNGKLYWYGPEASGGSDPMEETDLSGAATADFIFFNGRRVARLDLPGAVVHYYFSDHLGSTSVVTNASGSIEEESDYYPWGRERVITDTLPDQNYKFTGKERDTESTLDNFGARYYSSQYGRFMVADYFANDTHRPQPQSWNLYSYGRNNPLRFVDPTGEIIESTTDKKHKLTEAQKSQIAKDLQNKTGLKSIHFDKGGRLVYDKNEKAGRGSETLRNQITSAIDSQTTVFRLGDYSGTESIQFAQSDQGTVNFDTGVTTYEVQLDFGDFKNAKEYSATQALEAFTVGLVLSHEIAHNFPTPNAMDNGPGGVIDFVNGIQRQLNLPTRDTGSHRGSCDKGTCSIPFVDKNGQQRLLKWELENKRTR